ncbi:MAG: RluA family pseudouridine synthase [Candidatus Sungbacteria bacterium]|nr:RluA family pseudouridine synthase [Candidatus Sungbacteria bacterium]
MEIAVIYQSRDFVALSKPAGIAVHRGAGVRSPTVADWLAKKYPEVKGNQKTFEDLKQLFKERKVVKKYLALVVGAPKKKSGVINAPIGRSLSNPLKRGVGKVRGERGALTHYRLLERVGGFSLLEVEPKTGRTHQIRVHLASIGCPVAGDKTYGGKKAVLAGLGRQFLHAYSLEFSYPEGRRWHFEAALPEDLDAVLKRLRRLRKQQGYAKTG